MSKTIDLTNKRYGRLLVVGITGKNKHGQLLWKCQCDCGKETIVVGQKLRTSKTKSCGCLRSEKSAERMTKHGLTYEDGKNKESRLYTIWLSMRGRCLRKTNPQYKDYGGRGIVICDEWLDFKSFHNWSINNGYADNLSIDRIDNNKGYSPNNCRWTDGYTQGNNKRNNRRFVVKGENLTLAQLCRKYQKDYYKTRDRLGKGHTIEMALFGENKGGKLCLVQE